MSDELDGLLLRQFADGHRPLADAQFVAQIGQRLAPAAAQSDVLGTLYSAFGSARAGFAIGIGTVWRLPYTRLMALAAAAISLWAACA